MSLRYLLDTSIVSAPISQKPSRTLIRRLDERGPQCAIAAVVWNELVYGCERLDEGKRKRELEAYLHDVVRASFPILPYDRDAAAWHAAERARQERAGEPSPYVDGQIAAVASVNELVLVTANVRDFVRFEGLEVEDWTRTKRRQRST